MISAAEGWTSQPPIIDGPARSRIIRPAGPGRAIGSAGLAAAAPRSFRRQSTVATAQRRPLPLDARRVSLRTQRGNPARVLFIFA